MRGISSWVMLVENSAFHGRLPQPKRVSGLKPCTDESWPKLAGPAPQVSTLPVMAGLWAACDSRLQSTT